MTSPDKKVPPGAYVGTPGAPNGLSNLQKVTWQSAQQSIISNVLQSFQGVGAVSANLTENTTRAMTAANAAQAGATSAQVTATAAQDASTANASAINQLQTQQTQNQVGGASVTDNFQTWNTENWNTFKTGPVADMTTVNGQAGIGKSGNTDTGSVSALWKTPLMTDSESVSVVLGSANQAGSTAGSGPIIRASADLSTFVFAAVSGSSVHLGYGTRSGGTTTFHQWASKSNLSIKTGDTVTLTATGSVYKVLVGGVGMLSYTDAAATSPVGSANRYVGFLSTYYLQTTSWGSSSYFGFDFDSFAAADTTSPPIVGTGWSVYRQNSSVVPQATGANRVAAGTFDTIRMTNNVNVIDVGTGQIQVTKSGWYVVTVGLQWDSIPENYPRWAFLWSSPGPNSTWTAMRAGGSVSHVSLGLTCTFTVFAAAGTVLAPGYQIATNASVRGEVSGLATFFDGTLCSFS
ncbi:DUF7257 domain-containing protein [Nocardia amamiensis]|uniref:DUF7257 domain-containing protein n=1 Tax=Nocardia TaxID=1817 RepID=UPI0033E60639